MNDAGPRTTGGPSGGTGDPPPSLLTSALAEGRVALARSHRLHRLRGGFCGRGWCQQCPLETGDGDELACRLPGGPAPPLRFDPLRPLGLVGQRMTPWFYERRFRRPRWLRQTYLRALRGMSAAAHLPEAPAAEEVGAAEDVATDVLVVGGGPSGIAAAARLAASGARVALVTLGRLGGSAPLDPRRPGSLERDLETLRGAGARLLPDTLCLGLYEQEALAAALGPSGPFAISFERLVVATGAYDRLPLVPGNDLPGIVGLRAFERLAAQGALPRTTRVGLAGGPAELERGRAAAHLFGTRLAWSVDLGVDPLLRLHGRRRVRAARFAAAGRRPCDLLVVGITQPTYELQLHAGRRATLEGSPPIVRARGRARVPLLVVGEAAGVLDPGEGPRAAARDAAVWLETGAEDGEPTLASLGEPATPPPDAFVCLCEDVRVRDLTRAAAEGFADLELLKRRTGATTGPCQGKLCLGLLCEATSPAGVPASLPASRPPLRPVRISALAGGR